jgi:hypothetical protein
MSKNNADGVLQQQQQVGLAQIHYWVRAEFYGNAIQKMDELVGREIGDEGQCHWRLLRAYCVVRLGRPSEAMRQMSAMAKDGQLVDFKLAILHGLRIAHSNETNIGL